MPKPKAAQKKNISPTLAQIERLLAQQAGVILHAVDKRFDSVDKRFDAVDRRIGKLEERIIKLEESFTAKLNDLTNTLDRFLKRMTDMEDEFVFMKEDLKRVKAILREKLGVAID